jgi:hypothetical protein
MKKLACLLVCLSTGCVPFHQGNKDYQLVLGFGFMTVERTNDATVVSTKALGLHVGDRRFNAGLFSVTSTTIPTNANVVVEVRK